MITISLYTKTVAVELYVVCGVYVVGRSPEKAPATLSCKHRLLINKLCSTCFDILIKIQMIFST